MLENGIEVPQEINPDHFRVSIFGSARIEENDPRYNQIYRLAKLIAREGMDVVTGGGPGIMEAANKGHEDGRGNLDVHSIGLNIALPMEQSSNKHLDIKKDFQQFSKRLDYFMHLSNVVWSLLAESEPYWSFFTPGNCLRCITFATPLLFYWGKCGNL